MIHSRQHLIDRIIGRSVVTAEELLARVSKRLGREGAKVMLSREFVLAAAREILEDAEPVLSALLGDAQLAAWLFGVNQIGGRIPALLAESMPSGALGPRTGPAPPSPEFEPVIEFPFLDKAIESLKEKRIVTRETFDAMTDHFRQEAFTVARVQTESTIETIQRALTETFEAGETKAKFGKRLQEAMGESPLGRGHLETVYRTNVQTAFAEGQESIRANPLLADAFPYARYDAIRDGRVRDDHLSLETLGLDGTNVYRADDPMWDLFTPPWAFNCRCSKTFLTIRQAARLGVREAVDWKESGDPPVDPEWRLPMIDFRPEPRFVGVRRAA